MVPELYGVRERKEQVRKLLIGDGTVEENLVVCLCKVRQLSFVLWKITQLRCFSHPLVLPSPCKWELHRRDGGSDVEGQRG